MTAERFPRFRFGQRVLVWHDMGVEQGTILGNINPVGDEPFVFTVQFDDNTISTWQDCRIESVS